MTTPLWRNRDFTLLWTSQVMSTIGTRVTAVAYPLLVLALTGSPTLAGVVAFAQTLPFLLLFLPGGAWVDRWPRRPLMVGCELGRAVALGSVAALALVAGAGAVTVVHLAALVAARLHAAVPGRTLMIAITWLWAGLVALCAPAPSALWLGAVTAAMSFVNPAYNVVVTSAMYRITPEDMLGRVRSTAKLVAWGTIPLAGLLGGVLAEHLGPVPALLALAALLLAMALLTTAAPGLRALPGAGPLGSPARAS
jgi:MFS family permease